MKKSAPPSTATGREAPAKTGYFSGLCRSKAAGRPTQAEAEALGDHILDAGWELLLDQGFERFSFDRLARFARIGKPTIYARFANKEELLRALLVSRIEQRQREVVADAMGHELDVVLPALAFHAVEKFRSPEGRLIDRLIDWLDYEAGADRPSLRGWALESTQRTLEAVLGEANSASSSQIDDIPTAARFLLEGIAGHAKMVDARVGDTAGEADWAARYSAMILKHFARAGEG